MSELGLIKYDSMVHSIAECRAIDEIKDFRDKAKALQLYAQQAKNREAEAQCAEIRLRAERKCGVLIREEQAAGELATRADGADLSRNTTSKKTLNDINLSRDQSSKFQKLADIPDAEFEKRLADTKDRGDVPTTEGIIRGKVTPINKDAFAIGAAINGVIKLSELNFKTIIRTLPDKQRKDFYAETEEAVSVLSEFIGALDGYTGADSR